VEDGDLEVKIDKSLISLWKHCTSRTVLTGCIRV